MDLAERAQAEIIRLHREFERWFAEETEDFGPIEDSLASDFSFVPPSGSMMDRATVLEAVRGSRGDQRRLRIDNVRVLLSQAGCVVAIYEEWQDTNDYTTGRLSTVVFTADESRPHDLIWRHVHETWIQAPPV